MHDAERLYALLDRLGVVLRADDRQVGGHGALQPIHRALLRYLARCNRYSDTPGAAAAYLGQTKGTVSQSLGVLERRGYVKKRRDARDGRVIRLELTAKGRRAAGDEPGAAETAVHGMRRDEIRAAADLLERLLRGMQEAGGGRTFGTCATCRHALEEARGTRCGLTGDALPRAETDRICELHVWAGQ